MLIRILFMEEPFQNGMPCRLMWLKLARTQPLT